MGWWLVIALAVTCASADDDVQYVKSVKGGHSNFQYTGGANRLFNQAQNDSLHLGPNTSKPQIDYDVGVCYIEVPTASIAKDPTHVPAGNGSRPDLSRVRSCCRGYIRNIHNYKICDPVCTEECVNALCTAPDTCTCYPDHVKNLAGFCVATCPVGCQNGRCAGGECMCTEGYTLSPDSTFCVPKCDRNCGGQGNCTAPNSCECKPGYQHTPDGSCDPVCASCENGNCIAPNTCQCKQGYTKDGQDKCLPTCSQGCGLGQCIAPNVCSQPPSAPSNQGSNAPTQPPPTYIYNHPNYPYPQSGSQQQPNQNNQHSPQDNNQQNGGSQQYGFQTDDLQHQQVSGVAQCSQPCINGVCVEGNRCSCNPGYVLDRTDPTGTRCLPNCPGGCPNGVCSAPNFCICNMGYYKDHSVKGRPTCVRRIRRSAEETADLADLLIHNIPDL